MTSTPPMPAVISRAIPTCAMKPASGVCGFARLESRGGTAVSRRGTAGSMVGGVALGALVPFVTCAGRVRVAL
ncbi:MAG: hypothetical protein JNG88_07850 [Phycisphaerales bacterium]|nr:hypothetical protein [Phycisphaerales bacterium]